MNNKTVLSISALVVIAIIVVIIYAAVGKNPAPASSMLPSTATSTQQTSVPAPAKTSASASTQPTKPAASQAAAQIQQGSVNLAQYKSGISGLVTNNGIAYPTTVFVFRVSDLTHAYAISQTDQNGIYHFPLPPGSYVLGAGESNTPQCDHPQITIGQNSMVTANIACK